MKKILLPLLVFCLIVPCVFMLTACGGSLFGKSNDNKNSNNILTKAYGSDNISSKNEYETYANYTFHPTVMNQLPFQQAIIEYETSLNNFYSHAWDSQLLISGNGNLTVYSENKEHRISFSFGLYQEDSVNTRANLSVNHAINSSTEQNSRSINQIVSHSDKLKVTITRTSISLIFGDTKLELVYDKALNSAAMANSLSLYYSTNLEANGKFIDYTLKY